MLATPTELMIVASDMDAVIVDSQPEVGEVLVPLWEAIRAMADAGDDMSAKLEAHGDLLDAIPPVIELCEAAGAEGWG